MTGMIKMYIKLASKLLISFYGKFVTTSKTSFKSNEIHEWQYNAFIKRKEEETSWVMIEAVKR